MEKRGIEDGGTALRGQVSTDNSEFLRSLITNYRQRTASCFNFARRTTHKTKHRGTLPDLLCPSQIRYSVSHRVKYDGGHDKAAIKMEHYLVNRHPFELQKEISRTNA